MRATGATFASIARFGGPNNNNGGLKRVNICFLITLAPSLVTFSVFASVPPEPVNWVMVTNHAAWFERDSCGQIVFGDNMWIMGGWTNSFEIGPRDVWRSADGANWERATQTAAWEHGDFATTLVFHDRMWIFGGWSGGRLTNASPSSQVWFSTNGADWE